MITYDHHQVAFRIPTSTYRALKDVANKRFIKAVHEKSYGDNITLNSIVIEILEEAVAKGKE